MLTFAEMSRVDTALDTARDAVLRADEYCLALRDQTNLEILDAVVFSARVLRIVDAITAEQSDDIINRTMAMLLEAQGVGRAEANAYCATRNRLRGELAEIEQRVI